MKITLELADIDYASVVKFALPLLQGKLAEGDSEASKMLAQIAKMPPSIAAGMVDFLPQDTKNELAVMLVNQNKDSIVKAVTEYAEKKGLSFRISAFSAEE
jgi:DNA-directed RNA polymerase subunit F